MTADTIDGAAPQATASGRRLRAPGKLLAWIAGSAVVLVIAALTAALAWAAHYQPIGYGNAGGGLVGSIISKRVNNFPPMDGQIYVLPQSPHRGSFTVSLTNAGSFPVTIESATLNPPGDQSEPFRRAQPLRDSGPATYWPLFGSGFTGTGTRLAGLVLRPGQFILVRLPLVTAGCWTSPQGSSVITDFWVTVRFLRWTHQVQLSFTDPSDSSSDAIISRAVNTFGAGAGCR